MAEFLSLDAWDGFYSQLFPLLGAYEIGGGLGAEYSKDGDGEGR